MNIIEIQHLKKTYIEGVGKKEIPALHGISLAVAEGEVFGFLGPNGAGKTTTIKILMGLINSTSGTAQIFNQEVTNRAIRSKIGFLPETPSFYEYLTGFEILTFYGKLFGLSKHEINERITTLLEQVGLKSAAHLQLRKYSKGMLQRIGIAQALINDPALIILDEPMSGLDPIGRKEMREMILKLKAQGKTIFFSSHIIHDVQMLCDCVGILAKGKLLRIGRLDQIRDGNESLEECFIRIVQKEESE